MARKQNGRDRDALAGDLGASGGQRVVGPQLLCGGGDSRTVVLRLAEEAALHGKPTALERFGRKQAARRQAATTPGCSFP